MTEEEAEKIQRDAAKRERERQAGRERQNEREAQRQTDSQKGDRERQQ